MVLYFRLRLSWVSSAPQKLNLPPENSYPRTIVKTELVEIPVDVVKDQTVDVGIQVPPDDSANENEVAQVSLDVFDTISSL